MGGGAMPIDLPKIQLNSSSTAPSVISSSNNLNLPVPSNYAAPLRPPSSSSSSQSEICKKLEAIEINGKENGTVTGSGSSNNFILGPVPSKPEVENALAALQEWVVSDFMLS